jgi:hypothetical protein
MTLSPDVSQFLKGLEPTIPAPPLPSLVKALIREKRITHVRRSHRSGRCNLSTHFCGLIMINSVWVFIDELKFCYVVHSHFETIVQSTVESPDGIMSMGHDIFHSDEAFPGLSRCLGKNVVSIQVKRRRGCWPSFASAVQARQFCYTNRPLCNLALSRDSFLWFANDKTGLRCIVCNAMFFSQNGIVSHFSLS